MDARSSGIRTASALLLAAAAAGLAVHAAAYRFFYGMEAYEAVRKLQGLRIAVALFRQETGRMPSDITELVRDGTLAAVPELKLRGHPRTDSVRIVPDAEIKDTGGWIYVNGPDSPLFGRVLIDCSHRDEKGRAWSEF